VLKVATSADSCGEQAKRNRIHFLPHHRFLVDRRLTTTIAMPKPSSTQSILAIPDPGNNATVEYCQAVCDLVGGNLRVIQQKIGMEEDAKDKDTTLIHKHKCQKNKGNEDDSNNKKDEHQLYREWFLSVAAEMMNNQNHPGFVNVAGNDEKKDFSRKEANDNHQSVGGGACRIPCCMDCGASLQAGYKDTTIHVKSLPKKSRIRQPKKANNTRSKMMRPQLATWRDSVTTIRSTKYSPTTTGKTCRPKNGGASKQNHHDTTCHRNACRTECRNELVLTCGTCQSKTIYPGMPRRSATKAAAVVTDKKGGGSRNKRGVERGSATDNKASKIMAPAETTQQQALDDNLDFVPLTAPASAAAAAANFSNAGFGKKRKGNATPSSLLLPLQNPKKKKKKSQLMDFLSSLNN